MKRKQHMHPFIVSEDASSLTTVSSVDAKIKQLSPGLVIIDGAYLMDDEEGKADKGSPQALTNITRGMKRVAQRNEIPVLLTTQVLSWKMAKRSTEVTAQAIGYTSSFAQDSDVVLSVEPHPDADDQAIIRIVLSRSSRRGEVAIQWDWKNMSFEEVDEDDGVRDDAFFD
jgi:replicative DNA helicase